MMLIRLQYNSDQTEYRIHLPYVWLHMMLSRHSISSDLEPWRLMDYSSFMKGPPMDGTEWELFNANFRVLRSHAFTNEEKVEIADLHRGAIINGSLKDLRIKNKHLKLATAKAKSASRSSCCGNPKPFKESDCKTPSQGLLAHQCKAVQDGEEITVTMTDKTTLLLNAKGAPAADAFVMLEQVNSDGKQVTISECLEMKDGQAKQATETFLQDEFNKACDKGDILVVLRNTSDKAPTRKDIPFVFVSEEQFEEYYGLYAGRAFNAARRFTAESSKMCVKPLPRQVSLQSLCPKNPLDFAKIIFHIEGAHEF